MRHAFIAAFALLAASATAAPAGPHPGLLLYIDVDYRGASLPIDHDVRDFEGTGFNDAVSSIRVTGGTWQVCQGANFRGRCVTISRDAPDLVALGFNDLISSVRLVARDRAESRPGGKNR